LPEAEAEAVVLVVVILHMQVRLLMDPIMLRVVATPHTTEVPTVLEVMVQEVTVDQGEVLIPTDLHMIVVLGGLSLTEDMEGILVMQVALVVVVETVMTKVLAVVDTLEEPVMWKMVMVVAVDPTTQEPTKAIRLDSRRVWAK